MMKNKLFGLTAAAAVSLAILTGCPAEEKQQTGSETTTTAESPASGAMGGEMGASGEMGGQMAGETAATGTTTTAAAGNIDAKAIFQQKCSGCHGANGGGGMGPALANVEQKGDEFIHHRIVNGSPEKGMPAFGPQLSEAEINALVAYVKSL